MREYSYDTLKPDEAAAHRALDLEAFGSEPLWFDQEQSLLGLDAIRVLRDGDHIAACLSMIPMGQYFGGKPVGCVGIASLTVAPPWKGRGTSTELLAQLVEEAQQEGYGLATLYPSTLPVYRKVGFEVAGQRIQYSADARDLGTGRSAPGRLIRVDDHKTARPVLERLHAEDCKASAGGLDRHDLNWARVLEPPGDQPLALYLIEGRDGPEGYVATRHAERGILEVRDWAATTPAAARALLAYLAGHRSVVERVTWCGGPADSLIFHMPDKGWRIDHSKHWLTRIVDVERALANRGYPPGLSGSVTLEVSDPILPQNDGRFVLTVDDGAGKVERLGSGISGSAVILDIQALAPLYTGLYDARFLARAGRLEADPGSLAAASLIFAGPQPWMSDMF
jgi:predicted acetyltransferase